MVAEVFASVSAFKTMFDLAKALKDINDAAIRNGAVIELQEQILAAQQAQTAAMERISELEKQSARFETWEDEKQKYTLTRPSPGTVAYILKNDASKPEPSQLLCANCFEHGAKSYLQAERRYPGATHTLACHECGSDIYVHGSPRAYPVFTHDHNI